MRELNLNGFIMQVDNDNYYKGIDGENWYLNNEDFTAYDFKKYINESKRKNIRYRILLCETEKNHLY